MPDPVTAVIAGVSGITSLGGAVIASKSANKAVNAQVAAASEEARVRKEIFDKQVELQEPFRQGGLTAQNKLLQLLGIGGDTGAADYGSESRKFGLADFEADPGYAFRMSEGVKALDRSAAARLGVLSGPQKKAVTRFGQDIASSEYTNAFNRFQTERMNRLNPLSGIMGAGQTATNVLTNEAGNLGNALGENALGVGNARASGYVASGNAFNQALGGIGSTVQNAFLMNKLFK